MVITVEQRDYKKRDGTQQIRIKVAVKNKKKYISTDISVLFEQFNPYPKPNAGNKPLEYIIKHNQADLYNRTIRELVIKYEAMMLNSPAKDIKKTLDVSTGALDNQITTYAEYIYHIKRKEGAISEQTKQRNLRDIERFERFSMEEDLRFSFDAIDMNFKTEYVVWALSEGYARGTIGKSLTNLSFILKKALANNLTDNRISLDVDFTRIRQEQPVKAYLRMSELYKLYEYDTGKIKRELIKDALIAICCIGCRVSDYKELNVKDNIVTFNGYKYIKLKQQKVGGSDAFIPIMHILQLILDKYNDTLPSIDSESLFNKTVKAIVKDCGIDRSLEKIKLVDGVQTRVRIPLYQLVSTKIGRRTIASNMRLAGFPISQIMTITGHSTEANCEKYIGLEKEFAAIEMASHEFFGGTGEPVNRIDLLKDEKVWQFIDN